MSPKAHIPGMRTLALAFAAAAAAGAAQAQSLELERHRLELDRNRIEQDLRALQATYFRMQTQQSSQAVRNVFASDAPPIPLITGITGLADDPAAAELARQRAEQARARTVEQRLQAIRGAPR